MSTARIELLCGMIASGKSTYARKRADEGALVISHDDITEGLHATYRYEPELKPLYRAVMRETARLVIEAGRDVIIDRTHLDRDSRRFWLDFASVFGVEIIAVCFPVKAAEIHARRRFEADARGRTYGEWLKAARHHESQWEAEPIAGNEGFTLIRFQEETSA
jgi:predicted kinase